VNYQSIVHFPSCTNNSCTKRKLLQSGVAPLEKEIWICQWHVRTHFPTRAFVNLDSRWSEVGNHTQRTLNLTWQPSISCWNFRSVRGSLHKLPFQSKYKLELEKAIDFFFECSFYGFWPLVALKPGSLPMENPGLDNLVCWSWLARARGTNNVDCIFTYQWVRVRYRV